MDQRLETIVLMFRFPSDFSCFHKNHITHYQFRQIGNMILKWPACLNVLVDLILSLTCCPYAVDEHCGKFVCHEQSDNYK